MKLLVIFALYYVGYFLILQIDAKLTFPMVYRWSKRTKTNVLDKGCVDPTEPFQCPGTHTCISLQFLCDGHPGDCPDNYDEDPGLCIALKRPPKDSISRFLLAQYSNYGSSFIEYMFGSKAAAIFSKMYPEDAVNIISISLAVSPTIEEFAKVMEMTDLEKKRFANLLVAVNTGQVSDLPRFIVDTISEGLSILANKLIKTQFLQSDVMVEK